MSEDSDREILWQVPESVFMRQQKIRLLMPIIFFGLIEVSAIVLLFFAQLPLFALGLSFLALSLLVSSLIVVQKEIKRFHEGYHPLYIDHEGIGLCGHYFPRDEIEFVFLDYGRYYNFIKTKDTAPLDVQAKTFKNATKFVRSIPGRDKTRNTFDFSLIPDKEEFINALKECGIKVYVSRGYGAPVEEA